MRKKNQKGFTLIELLLVVAIIGILAALAIPQFGDQPKKAKMARMLADIAVLDRAAATYKAENGNYPTLAQLKTLVNTYPTPPAGVKTAAGAAVTAYTYDLVDATLAGSGTTFIELDGVAGKSDGDASAATPTTAADLSKWGL